MTIKRDLLRIPSALGVGEPALALYDEFGGDFGFDRSLVSDEVRRFELSPEDRRGDVLFAIVQGKSHHTYKHCLLAHAFRLRGYRPILLLCDRDLQLCHFKDEESDPAQCSLCHYYGESVIEAFGLGDNVVGIDEELPTEQPPDVDLDGYAMASTREHLRRHHVDTETDPGKSVYEGFRSAATSLASVTAALIDERDVKCLLSHDGAYVYGGIPIVVGDAHGIPSYSCGRGFREETIMFGKYRDFRASPFFSDRDVVDSFLSQPLNADEIDEIDTIMERRAAGTDATDDYSPRTDESIATAAPDDERLTTAMFTNLIWDASLKVTDCPFPDVFKWISTTIKTLGDRRDVDLVVKTHPAEAIRGTNERVDEWIYDQFGSLPSNVTLLEPSTDVNTYNLIEDVDVGIVYNSTVGLEMAYNGTPVVTGGETHYRSHGFTVDPDTPEEYTAVLEDVDDVTMTDTMQERAVRYTYYLFVEKHVPFQPLHVEKHEALERPQATNARLGTDNEHVDRIIEALLAGEEVTRHDLTRN